MSAYLTRHFTKTDLHNTNVKTLPEPVSGDSEDFTEALSNFVQQEDMQQSNFDFASKLKRMYETYEKNMHWVLFSQFPYVFLSLIFISLSNFNNAGYSDIIACGFLMQMFYFVASFRSLYT